MTIEIKHYNETVKLSINEDQYAKHGLDETTAYDALMTCTKALSTLYSQDMIDECVVDLAEVIQNSQ